jgi:hypothetical protein
VTARDVRDLLTLYGVHDDEYREALIGLARQSRERTWWTDYRDVMRPGNFVGLEAEASSMRVWEPVVLPGLLQTEAYMRALMRTGRSSDPPENIDRRVALRIKRQDRLKGPSPLTLSAIVDESVIRRVVGGADVMGDQLRHLLGQAQLPNVILRVLPLDAGEHLFLSGPAALLEFRETTHSDVVYLEGLAGDYYEEQPLEVARYRNEFERLSTMALDRRMSVKMIESILDI